MLSIFFHSVNFGFHSARTNFKYDSLGRKYSVSHTVAIATATSVEIAAPATPYGRWVTHPKIRNGARTMFRITEAVDTPPQSTRARLRGAFIKRAKERKRDYTVDWVHLKLNDQAQRTVLCKDPFKSRDERVERLIASL